MEDKYRFGTQWSWPGLFCSYPASVGSCQFLVLAFLQKILVKLEPRKHFTADVPERSTQLLWDLYMPSQKQTKKWGDAGLDFQPRTKKASLACLYQTKAQPFLMYIQSQEQKMQHKLLLRQLLGPEHSYLNNQNQNPRFLQSRSFYAVAGLWISKIACLAF